ncbi:hypothetical protein EW026_g4508 [Hermanssonia centrifuga]|uniref:Calcipressin n=1 Tax=Hermanssonia centrifuga TaxID=98765 RepID=A0A4V3XAC0_9APHY|nr:hypothetical protein EW026_g4508 [Hermanssonia centrifuga]
MLIYYDEDAAELAKQTSDNLPIDETATCPATILRVFRAEPTSLEELTNSDFLCPPKLEKNFLISPPGSPPVGWEPIKEDPPNSTPLADDLMAALRKLQVQQEGKNAIEVLIEPENGSGISIYVEDCDDGADEADDDDVVEWPYGCPLPSMAPLRPMPTALPPMPVRI